MTRPWIVITLVAYGIIAAIAMVILGWPEATPTQVVLLELAALPLQAALGFGLWRLSRRMRAPGARGRLALRIGSGVIGIGLVVIGLAYLTGPRGMVHLGLALVWIGLLLAMLVVVTHLPRRPLRPGSFSTVDDEDDPDDEEATDGTRAR